MQNKLVLVRRLYVWIMALLLISTYPWINHLTSYRLVFPSVAFCHIEVFNFNAFNFISLLIWYLHFGSYSINLSLPGGKYNPIFSISFKALHFIIRF